MKVLLALFTVLAVFTVEILCGRVLVLSPVASPSHRNVMEGIYSSLAERGHEIVAVVSGKPRKAEKNVQEIIPLESVDFFSNTTSWEVRKGGTIGMLMMDWSFVFNYCRQVYEHPGLQEAMKKPFDLVIYDAIGTQCIFGLVHQAKAPIISVVTCAANNALVGKVGNHLPPSFVPDISSPYSDEMNFWERTMNIFYNYLTHLMFWMDTDKYESIYREYVGQDTPGVDEIASNASLVFVNAHLSFDSPKPLLPDVIEIGGAHCRPGKPLPKELDEFVSGAKDGLILFSLGSIVKPEGMPEEVRKLFLNVFGRLKQRVLWKWPLKMNDLPPNVKLSPWVPQQDVLAHPNTKLFITHGGLLSTQESIYHAVPTIYFPFFADQDNNAQHAERVGIGKALEILTVTETELEQTINEMLGNPSYREKIQNLSKIFRDQPQTPSERAAFWAEYVMRHKGAPHLRSAARKLNFFQYHSLDSVVFIGAVLAGLLWLLKILVFKVFRALCKSSAKTKKVKSN